MLGMFLGVERVPDLVYTCGLTMCGQTDKLETHLGAQLV